MVTDSAVISVVSAYERRRRSVVDERSISAAIETEGSVADKPRRVEAPPERIVEESVARDESIGAIPGIPVPAVAPESWTANISASRTDVRFRQVRRTQATPVIEIAFELLFIEAMRLHVA